MMDITTPAINRLLDHVKPYYSKRYVSKEIVKVSPVTINRWEGLLIDADCQYSDFYKPRQPLNYYQVFCLARLADWRADCPSLTLDQLKGLIRDNIGDFQLEHVMGLSTKLARI